MILLPGEPGWDALMKRDEIVNKAIEAYDAWTQGRFDSWPTVKHNLVQAVEQYLEQLDADRKARAAQPPLPIPQED